MRKKRKFLLIFLIIFCGCSQYGLVCSNRDTVEEAGINHFQQFVDQVNQFKSKNGRYPKSLQELGQSVFDEGTKIPSAKITQSSYRLVPEENYFLVEFFFDREKTCFIGNNRACRYTSTSEKWSCY